MSVASSLDFDLDPQQRFEEALATRVMPLVVELGYGTYWERYQQLREIERRGAAELAERSWRRLQEMLEHAAATVPHYRDALAAAGVTASELRTPADLAFLPPLDKRTIVSAFPDRITSSTSDRSQWRYRSTSGTAYRIMLVNDASARQWRYAQHLRSLEVAAAYRLGRRQTILRTEACLEACAASAGEEHTAPGAAALPVEREWPPLGFAQLTLQETVIHARDLTSTSVRPELLDAHLERIRASEPHLLRGMPMFLLLLARRLQATGQVPPKVGRIIVQDALAPARLKRELAATFGASVRETYGSSELGSIAAEDAADQRYGGALSLVPDLVWVEVLGIDGTPVPAGEPGILTISSTVNRAMPLLRYQVGDVGRLVEEPSPTGRNTPRLRVMGRVREALAIDGRFVTASEVYDTLDPLPGLDFFQLVERAPGRLELRLVPSHEGALEPADAVAVLRGLVGEDVEIEPRLVKSLRPEESGKFVFVKALDRDAEPRDA